MLELLVAHFHSWLKTDTGDGEKQINIKSKLHLETWKPRLPICRFVSYVKQRHPTLRKSEPDECVLFQNHRHPRQTHPPKDGCVLVIEGPRLHELVRFCPEGMQMNHLVGKITPKAPVLLPSRAPTSLASKRAMWVLHLNSPCVAWDSSLLSAPQGSFLDAVISFRILIGLI